MNTQTDWARWSTRWQQQPPVDIDMLLRRLRRRRARSRRFVIAKAVLLVIMLGVLGHRMMDPASGMIWRIWFGLVMAMLVASMTITLRVRRDAWRSMPVGMPALLELTARQARRSIRSTWVGMTLFLLLITLTACMETWWLWSPHGMRGAPLDLLQPIPLTVFCIVGVAGTAWNVIHIRRQKRRLHEAEAWLREYTE